MRYPDTTRRQPTFPWLDITENTAPCALSFAPISYNNNLRNRILEMKSCNLPTGLSCTSAMPLKLLPLPGQSMFHQATDARAESTIIRDHVFKQTLAAATFKVIFMSVNPNL